MYRLLGLALVSLALVAHADVPAPAESGRIAYLFAAIEALQGAQFIRNGQAYDTDAALHHLHTKLRLSGAHVKTAEDFIRYCGSASSVSGRPYEIRFADGHTERSADFLQRKLAEFDHQHGVQVRAAGTVAAPGH
jgi:hypothetical protein